MPNKRETHKDIEESGRKWRIRKWSARLANYWINKLVLGARASMMQGEDMQTAVAAKLAGLNKADFFEFQNDCLSVCSELQEMPDNSVAPIPVLRVDGTWNVADIDDDNNLVMALTMQAFVFSVQDPFDGNGSKE